MSISTHIHLLTDSGILAFDEAGTKIYSSPLNVKDKDAFFVKGSDSVISLQNGVHLHSKVDLDLCVLSAITNCQYVSSLTLDKTIYVVLHSASQSPTLYKVLDRELIKVIEFPSTGPIQSWSIVSGDTAKVAIASTTQDSLEIFIYRVGSDQGLVHWSTPYSPLNSGSLSLFSCNIASAPPSVTVTRCAVTTSSGSLIMVKKHETEWTRDESLSAVTGCVLVDLPIVALGTALSQEHDELDETSRESLKLSVWSRYKRRLAVHLDRLISVLTSKSLVETRSNDAVADRHGFKKYAIFATSVGKVTALETLQGQAVWSFYTAHVKWTHVYQTREAKVKTPPLITLVGKHCKENATLLVLINALTGQMLGEPVKISGSIKEALILESETESRVKVTLLIKPNLEIQYFPSFPSQENQASVYLTNGIGSTSINGYSIEKNELKSTWTLDFPSGETLAAHAHASKDPVASLGRVLGSRKVLYKYLNPSLATFMTLQKSESSSTVFLYLVDTVSGQLLYRNVHFNGGHRLVEGMEAPSIFCVQQDHWIVYSFWNHGPSALDKPLYDSLERPVVKASSKSRKQLKAAGNVTENLIHDTMGVEMVVLELYEDGPDIRMPEDVVSSYSPHRPSVLGQSYMFSRPLVGLGVTTSRAGITVRDLLVGLQGGGMLSISKRWMDPRRPTSALSSADKEEGLALYSPELPFVPTNLVTHELEIFGMQRILTAPTDLESTSVVIGYGHDIFGSRQSPSKNFDVLQDDFGRVSLIGTIIVLACAVFTARYYLNLKKFKEYWK